MSGVSGWRIERLPITHPDAALLVEEVQEEYVVRYGGVTRRPIDPTYFEEPAGAFFVGYLDGVPVATGAWRRRTDVEVAGTCADGRGQADVRRPGRPWPRPGPAMLAHLEETARAAGAEAMVLETGMRQPEAISLYHSAGYKPVAGFGFYKNSPLSRCFARSLVVGNG